LEALEVSTPGLDSSYTPAEIAESIHIERSQLFVTNGVTDLGFVGFSSSFGDPTVLGKPKSLPYIIAPRELGVISA
jgi:hypothetical protein